MGAFNGDYSRDPRAAYDEEKRYPTTLVQEGIPWIDADENVRSMGWLTGRRRLVQLFGDYGSPNNGFEIHQSGSSTVNNFTVNGGGGTAETAARFFMKGLETLLYSDVEFLNTGSNEGERSVHSRITGLATDGVNTTVTDSAANYAASELVGRTLRPDITNADFQPAGADYPVAITANTATTITFADAGSSIYAKLAAGQHYLVEPSTPAGARTDAVYLNVYLDEYNSSDDPGILHTVGNQTVEGQLRLKVIQNIFVREDRPSVGALTDYVDSDGNQHYIFEVATLSRLAANTNILTAMITNNVPSIGLNATDLDDFTPLKPVVNTGDTTKVYVSAGQALNVAGSGLVSWGGGASPAFSVVTADARWDALVLMDDGTLKVIQGTQAASPTKPAFLTGVPIAYVYIDETGTVDIDSGDIDDARALFTTGPSVKVLNPDAGTINSQLTLLGMNQGDRFCVPPGSYTLGSSLSLNVDDVSFVGTKASIIDSVSYEINITGDNVKIYGMEISSSSASSNCLIDIASSGTRICDVKFTGTADRVNHVELLSGCDDCLISRCEFDGNLGGADPSRHIFVDVDSTAEDINISECIFTSGTTDNDTIEIGMDNAIAHGVNLRIERCRMTLSATGGTSDFRVGIAPASSWIMHDNTITGTNGDNGHIAIVPTPFSLPSIGPSLAPVDLTITNNRISNCVMGTWLQECGKTLIEGNNISIYGYIGSGCKYGAVVFTDLANSQVRIIGNEIRVESSGGAAGFCHGIYVAPNGGFNFDSLVISSNHIEGYNTDGTAYLTGIGNYSASSTTTTITGNFVKLANAYTGAVYMKGIESAYSFCVTGNTVYVEGNDTSVDVYGIEMDKNQSVVSGNVVSVGTDGAGDVYGIYGNSVSSLSGNWSGVNAISGNSYAIYLIGQSTTASGNYCTASSASGTAYEIYSSDGGGVIVGNIAQSIYSNVSNGAYTWVLGNYTSGAVTKGGTGSFTKEAHNTGSTTHDT